MDFVTKLFGIVGYPLGHSMSPALHNWAFHKVNYPGVYLAWPEEPDKLENFFQAVRTLHIQGGNITIPHKIASMALVDEVTENARKIGAINTFYWQNGQLWGENTDLIGFMAPLKGKKFNHALVLGAGGVSRAVLTGLKLLDVPQITITNRTWKKAETLAKEFDVDAIAWEERMKPDADLIVNATSQGMTGEQENMSPYEPAAFKGRTGLVYDIIYNPLETLLLKEAKANGWQTENGLLMFVEQAREAFRIWTDGREIPLAEACERVKTLL